ncbi:MAG: PLP-dependent aminotransferase family protein [Chloroflexota bacterium]
MSLDRHFSDRAQRMHPLAIRDILRRGASPDIIPFIAGQPVPALFPTKAIGYQANHVFETLGPDSLQYGRSEGYEPLREWVASQTNHVNPNNVVIISGSQQALDLAGKLFIMPGDKIVVAAPTYAGAIGTFQVYGAEFLGVQCDNEGMLPDALEQALQQEPRLIYCIPNFMNPTGVDMSLARRQQVVELATKYDVPILEDDPYGALRFEGARKPCLYELAPEQVLYASTFSKTLAPGLRLAWLVVPDWAQEKVVMAKQTADLQTASYTQRFIHQLLEDDFLDRQISQLCGYYRQQRNWMLDAMARHFPAEVRYAKPTGGMFIWCELPAHVNTTTLLEKALAQNVAYMPGGSFYTDGSGQNTLRLSFTLATKEQMKTGIKTLGSLFGEAIDS